MSDMEQVKQRLREQVADLAPYLFPNGHREAAHWCVGSLEGEPGKSFKICIAGEKAGLWGDFAESGKHCRSLLDLWMQVRKVDFKTALQEAADWLGYPLHGSNGSTPTPRKSDESPATLKFNAKQKPFNWRLCVEALTAKHLERLGNRRGYSVDFCSWLHKQGLVGLHDGLIAFPVHDDRKIVAAHVRQKDRKDWYYVPKGTKVRPFVIGELIAGDPIHIFESQWDAFAFMDKSGERSGIIITRGANNGAVVAGLIPENSKVYVWTQNDAPGQKWAKDVCAHTKCAVKSAKTPSQFADLNDWTSAGATVDHLVTAMTQAETIHEPEKSWHDALKAAVVTSSELRELQLVPRKKLLGDWFCEGDLGFIFAFRGVGKTWLAVAIAQALANGGKLGEWQAHEPVKVLYVDGEMPPDLMRDRCGGLQGNE